MNLDKIRDQGALYFSVYTGPDLREDLKLSSKELASAQEELRLQQVFDFYKQEEFRKILTQAQAQGISFLVYKGSALAYRYYPCSVARERLDHDVLVNPQHAELLQKLLFAHGYQLYPQLKIFNEKLFYKIDEFGIQHVWDLHQKISNRTFFSKIYSFEELWQNKIKIINKEFSFNAPGPVDHFLILLCHMAGHHAQDYRWIWLKDLSLIWQAMTLAEKNNLFLKAKEKKISSLLQFYLQRMSEEFPDIELISQAKPALDSAAWYLRPRSWYQIVLKDVWELDSFLEKFRFLQELIWPSGEIVGTQKLNFKLRVRRILGKIFTRRHFLITFVFAAGLCASNLFKQL